MNRENKRKTFEKGYYKTHACNEVFTCRNCGRIVVPEGQAVPTATIARIACAACTLTRSPATGHRTAAD